MDNNRVSAKQVVIWLSLAVVLRLAATFTAVHSDIVFINFFPSKFAYEGVIDIYRYIDLNFSAERVWSYYPPLTYFTLGISQAALKSFDPGFALWISEVYEGGLREWLTAHGPGIRFFRYLFFMKLPYAVFDAVCFFAIWKYLDDKKARIRALKLWSLNPVILYGVYMFGQVDIMPAALTVLSIFYTKREKFIPAVILLSCAALFKTFSIFLLPLFIVTGVRSYRDVLNRLLLAALPFILVLLPLVMSGGRGSVESLFPGFYLHGNGVLAGLFVRKIIFIMLYFVIAVRCFRQRGTNEADYLLRYSIAVIMAMYVMFFVPVHYFVWVVPLLIIAVVKGIIPAWLYWGQIVCLFVYNLNSARTTTSLLAPLNPEFFYMLPGLPDLMHKFGIRWGGVMLSAQLLFVLICVIVAMEIIGQIHCLKRVPRSEKLKGGVKCRI